MKNWRNGLIRFLIPLKQGKTPQSIDHILVVSTTALGDTLWATPAIANVRLKFPKATIAVLTSKTGREILQHNPNIDKIYLLKEPMLFSLFSQIRTLRKEKFDVALIFHASQRLILPLCRWSRIPRIIATKGLNKGLDDLATDLLEPKKEHEIERRFRLIAHLGAPASICALSYYVQEDERKAVDAWLGRTDKKLVAVHPGSKEPFRRWPAEWFAWVGQEIQKACPAEIFLTGTPQEEALLQKIHAALPSARILPFSSIRNLGAFLERMDLVLSNDTGPFHLACALNRPAVGLYASTDPALCGPFQAPQAHVLFCPPTCHPCLKRRCRDPFCFRQISSKNVLNTCTKILSL
jgi:lipopolysaccharide heptosyltransferase II